MTNYPDGMTQADFAHIDAAPNATHERIKSNYDAARPLAEKLLAVLKRIEAEDANDLFESIGQLPADFEVLIGALHDVGLIRDDATTASLATMAPLLDALTE